MNVLRRLFPVLCALAIVGGFFYLAVKDLGRSQAPAASASSQATVDAAGPAVVDPQAAPEPFVDSLPVEAGAPAATTPTIESARAGCLDETRKTGTISFDANTHCAQYARLLNAQYASLQPSSSYPEQSTHSASTTSNASTRVAQAPPRERGPDRAQLKRACGDKFDDISWRDQAEQQRRLDNRLDSLTQPNQKEIDELRCRIYILKASR